MAAPKITRFEDLPVWKDARKFANAVYTLTFSEAFIRDYALRDQTRRAAISIMANIAEGFDRDSGKDFIRFLRYSIASASEVRSHLHLASDLEYINETQHRQAIREALSISRQIGGFIKYLESKTAAEAKRKTSVDPERHNETDGARRAKISN